MLVSAPAPAARADAPARAGASAPVEAAPRPAGPRNEPLLRQVLGAALRYERTRQHRTLRDVSKAARVSLGYLSEIERGQKEASSELLASICAALQVRLLDVLHVVLTGATQREPGVVETMPVRRADAPVVVDRAA